MAVTIKKTKKQHCLFSSQFSSYSYSTWEGVSKRKQTCSLKRVTMSSMLKTHSSSSSAHSFRFYPVYKFFDRYFTNMYTRVTGRFSSHLKFTVLIKGISIILYRYDIVKRKMRTISNS